jgi:two-component system, NarL family, nitrate/nitrite response regulator NarL
MGTGSEFERPLQKADDSPDAQSQGEALPRSAGARRQIRVLVANRTAIESELLVDSIGKDRRFVAVGWGVRYADIDKLALHGNPDVLLITPKLDDQANAGFDVLADFRISYPAVKTVVLLESHDSEFVVQSFRLGARGVFSKDLPLKLLTKCITRVSEGQIWATNEQFGFVMEALAFARNVHSGKNDAGKLSAREFEVVKSLADGLSNERIAKRLKLNRNTNPGVGSHKLGPSEHFDMFSAREKPSTTTSADWKKEPGD